MVEENESDLQKKHLINRPERISNIDRLGYAASKLLCLQLDFNSRELFENLRGCCTGPVLYLFQISPIFKILRKLGMSVDM